MLFSDHSDENDVSFFCESVYRKKIMIKADGKSFMSNKLRDHPFRCEGNFAIGDFVAENLNICSDENII